MPSSFTQTLDRSAEEAFLRRYTAAAVTHVLDEAAKVGAAAAAKVMRAAAPVGTSKREGQYYRRSNLGHGTFQKSVRNARIRGRGAALGGLQSKTVGQVIGPMGKNAFTRNWRESGTRTARGTHWVERIATEALAVAQRGSEAVLDLYADV